MGKDKHTRIAAVINQKGGVGKTTSTVNIGAALRKQGKRVLLIDLDPQANLTVSLGISTQKTGKSAYDIFLGKAKLEDVLIEKGGMYIIPSGIELSEIEYEFYLNDEKDALLKNNLSPIEMFDFVLIDCPPSLGLLTINALAASDEVLMPVHAEFLSLQGASKLIELIDVVKRRINPGLKLTGIFITRFDKRKSLHREVREKLHLHFGDKLFSQTIRENVALAEAPGFGCDIFAYKPKSRGAEEYYELSKEFVRRGK